MLTAFISRDMFQITWPFSSPTDLVLVRWTSVTGGGGTVKEQESSSMSTKMLRIGHVEGRMAKKRIKELRE